MSRQRSWVWSGLVCLLAIVAGASWLRAEDPQDKPAGAPTALQIAQWIRDLDSDEFQVRQQASSRLLSAGKHAASQVAKAAEGDSADVTARCLDILSKLWRST